MTQVINEESKQFALELAEKDKIIAQIPNTIFSDNVSSTGTVNPGLKIVGVNLF